jgi:hypothetical protein
VGLVLIEQRRLGSVFTAGGAQSAVKAAFLSAPSAAATTVSVTSSDSNVASVAGPVVVPPGDTMAAFTIQTGVQGVATLTLRAGANVAQMVVVVGTPPASLLPLIAAPIVGVEVKK